MNQPFIVVGSWKFFPAAYAAQNIHNGGTAYFALTNGQWSVFSWEAPPTHLEQLGGWFAKWITGRTIEATIGGAGQ